MPTVLGVLGTWECVSSVSSVCASVFRSGEGGSARFFFFYCCMYFLDDNGAIARLHVHFDILHV